MSNSDNSSRWWEFYAVRYGMGTVVGAVVFFFLCNTNPTLRPMLFGAEAGKIDGPLLVLLAGYGLAYCYVASAPILVFHVARFFIVIDSKISLRRALVIFAPLLFAIMVFSFSRKFEGPKDYLYVFVFALAFMMFWPQILAIGFTLFKTKRLFAFYRKLADRRHSTDGGIVESYRHLREHGNSFLIIVMEIILAIILFTAANLEGYIGGKLPAKDVNVIMYISIILIWISPAALVWVVGSLLEREFCDA